MPVVIVVPTGASSVSSRPITAISIPPVRSYGPMVVPHARIASVDSAGAAHQFARAGAGLLALAHGDLARDDRRLVAPRPLDQAPGAAGQVEDELGQLELQLVVVDEVEVGLVTRGDDPAVAEPVE